MTSEGEDRKDSERCEACKGSVEVSLCGVVLPFPLDRRAIVIVLSIFTCCFAEKIWNKPLIEADESLISLLSKYVASILQFCKCIDIVMIMIILDAMKIAWRKKKKLDRNFHTLCALA